MTPRFRYCLRDQSGQLIRGCVEADDRLKTLRRLLESGYVVTDLVEIPISPLKAFFARQSGSWHWSPLVSGRDVAVLCRQLSTLLQAGVPLLSALATVEKQTVHRHLRRIVIEIRQRVHDGAELSEALSGYPAVFPSFLAQMVRAGEVTGRVDQVFAQVARYLERSLRVKQKLLTATIYPGLLSLFAILVVIFLLTVVIPNFASVFHSVGATLPWPTRLLMRLGDLTRTYLVIIGGVGLTTGLFAGLLRKICPPFQLWWDQIWLRFPLIGWVNRQLLVARFCQLLHLLIGAGVGLSVGLRVVAESVGNRAVAREIRRLEERIAAGEDLRQPLSESVIFPPMVAQLAAVGEESGSLEEMFSLLAAYYEGEAEYWLESMIGLVEPGLILLLSVVVGFVAISMLWPMFEALELIQ